MPGRRKRGGRPPHSKKGIWKTPRRESLGHKLAQSARTKGKKSMPYLLSFLTEEKGEKDQGVGALFTDP